MKQSQLNERFPLAMAWVAWQSWEALYSDEEALTKGTIFPGLFKPFEGVCG